MRNPTERGTAEFTMPISLADWVEKELRPAVELFRLQSHTDPNKTSRQNGTTKSKDLSIVTKFE
jgi:hypothetical protein